MEYKKDFIIEPFCFSKLDDSRQIPMINLPERPKAKPKNIVKVIGNPKVNQPIEIAEEEPQLLVVRDFVDRVHEYMEKRWNYG